MASVWELASWSQSAGPLVHSASPSISLAFSPNQASNTHLKLIFHLRAWIKPGSRIYLLGDREETGGWGAKSINLLPEGMFCEWRSSEVSFEVRGSEFSLHYFYFSLNNKTDLCEELTSIRSFRLSLSLVDSLTYTLQSDLIGPDQVTIQAYSDCSLLRNISITGSFGAQLEHLMLELGRKNARISLKRLLILCVYFKRISTAESGTLELAGGGNCEKLLNITRILCSKMTEEIRPIVGKIVLWMGRCCAPYKKIMKSITNSRLVQRKKVDFGCESEVLTGLLEELFSSTPRDDMGMIRVIVLNSIRGAIQSLWVKSTRPELLLMYDVWISVLQQSYIESRFLSSDPSNIPNLLHQVSILAEYTQLGAICPEIQTLAEELQENQEMAAQVLIQMLETATWWVARYVSCAKRIKGEDVLGERKCLIDIGAESVELLLPVLSRALHTLSHSLNSTFTLSLCPGTATGKVLLLSDFDSIPSDITAAIVLFHSSKERISDIPALVKGIIWMDDPYLSSHMVAHCLANKVPLGVVTREWRGDILQKVQLTVTLDHISLL